MKNKINREWFDSKNPTLLGVVLGIKFYEDPVGGDLVELIEEHPDGSLYRSDLYEVPYYEDLKDALQSPENS